MRSVVEESGMSRKLGVVKRKEAARKATRLKLLRKKDYNGPLPEGLLDVLLYGLSLFDRQGVNQRRRE